MSAAVYEPRIRWDAQESIPSLADSPDTQTSGLLPIPTTGRQAPTTTVPDAIAVLGREWRVPVCATGGFGQWLDLWITRRYAGGALPATLDATQAINTGVATLEGFTAPVGAAPTAASMLDAVKAWTGLSTRDLAGMLGVRSTKTLYNWRKQQITAPRSKTLARLLRIHALIRSIILHMGPLDGRAWLASGEPPPLDLLKGGDLVAVERLARAAGVQPGAVRRTLSAEEADTLRRGGLRLAPATPALRASVAARTAALTERLLRTGHTVGETARLLGLPVGDAARHVEERKIYAVLRGGEWIVPDFQFDGPRLIPGVEQVMPRLPADAHVIEVYTWFTSPTADLEDDADRSLSPRTWLLAGRPVAPVIALAEDL